MKLRQIESQARKIKFRGEKTANFNFSKVKKRINSPFTKAVHILLFYSTLFTIKTSVFLGK